MPPGKLPDCIVIPVGEPGIKSQSFDIILLHDAADPDIDRERFVLLESKKQDAVGSFWADTVQFHQFFAGILVWEPANRLLPLFLISDRTRSTKNIGLAVAQPALCQTIKPTTSDGGGIGKCVIRLLFEFDRFSELLRDGRDPASDCGNVGVRRADIGDRALPGRLPDKTKSGASADRCVDERVLVNGFYYLFQIEIQGKIVTDECGLRSFKYQTR